MRNRDRYQDNPVWKRHCTFREKKFPIEIPCWLAFAIPVVLLAIIFWDCIV